MCRFWHTSLMEYSSAKIGQYVKFTPLGASPALLREDHPGRINSIVPSSTYVMVDWAWRGGTVPQYAVYEAKDLTVISEAEYDALKGKVRRLDEEHGAPPPAPEHPRHRVPGVGPELGS